MAKPDYYKVLGVDKGADASAVKTAYRRLAMKYHPDRNAGDSKSEEKFKEIQEAYSCLSDEQKRAAYDRFGHAAFESGGGGGAHGADFSSVFDDVFSDFFGGQKSGGNSRRQRVLDIPLTFEEMVNGCEKTIRLSLPQNCDACAGSGAAKGGKARRCATCGGAGAVQSQRGFFAFQQTCPACRGKGSTIDKPCTTCSGNGKVMKERNLSVKLPAGVEDGTMLRLKVDGGDEIFLRPSVTPHPLFQRDGDDLHIEIPVSITTAILGGKVAVPSVTGGKIQVSIPEGIQSGQLLRVPGCGVPHVRTPKRRGSILCHIVVETPVNLSAKQKELLQEFDNSLKNKHSPKGNSWLDKVKDLFTDSA